MFINKVVVATFLILVSAVIIAGFLFLNQRTQKTQPEIPPPSPAPVIGEPTPTSPPIFTITPTLTPTPTTSRIQNIIVTAPKNGDTVSSPLIVTGQARTFEQTVNFRLRQANGRILMEDFTTARAFEAGQFGLFEISLNFPESTQQQGVLEVFQISPKDGTEIDKIIISVRFANVELID